MTDLHYSEPELIGLYEFFNPWADDNAFYLNLPTRPSRILDAGCGTGMLARAYAHAGHEVVGIDPAPGMIDHAQRQVGSDRVQWQVSPLQDYEANTPFDWIVMTGHAFQCLLTEEDILKAFQKVKSLLTPTGAFVFESRNPASAPWERWIPELTLSQGILPDGTRYRCFHQVTEVIMPRIRFVTEYKIRKQTYRSHSTLAFYNSALLRHWAAQAGLKVQHLWGDWDKRRFHPEDSPEMIFNLSPELV